MPVLPDAGADDLPEARRHPAVARPRAGRLPAEVLERIPARGHPRVVGDRPLKEAKTRLVIPAFDVNTGKVYLFKTPHHPGYINHADLPAVDVALATSAAPTYFPAHPIPGRGTFIDGGLWANCPAMVGLVEALDFLEQTPDRVRMLSLSTTSYPFRLDRPVLADSWLALAWAFPSVPPF